MRRFFEKSAKVLSIDRQHRRVPAALEFGGGPAINASERKQQFLS